MLLCCLFYVRGVAWCNVEGAAPFKPSWRGVARHSVKSVASLRGSGVAMVEVWGLTRAWATGAACAWVEAGACTWVVAVVGAVRIGAGQGLT